MATIRPIRMLAAAFAAVLLLAPTTLATVSFEPGLPRACDRSGNANTCREPPPPEAVIPDTVVEEDEDATWEGDWRQVGTVIVYGNASVSNGTITQEPTSGGWIVMPGGRLTFLSAQLQESANGSEYGILAHEGSAFALDASLVHGGSGVEARTSDLRIAGSAFVEIPLALRLVDVTATIEGNRFVGNTVSVNQTGGAPTLRGNHFEGGEVCVRDWRSDPTIVHNVFRGCHIGIYHEQSESTLSHNDMMDDAYPPGVGILVRDTMSPTIEGNTIANYGTGIRIVNARAYVRNNTIADNVGAGIEIDTNSAPMDVQGNLVQGNGGDGIRLVRAHDVPLLANRVLDNGGVGIALVATPDARVAGNEVRGNAAGIVVDAASARPLLDGNVVEENRGDGIATRAAGSTVRGGSASANAGHGLLLEAVAGMDVSDVTANGNGGDGVVMRGSEGTVERVNASGNARHGFRYDPTGPLQLVGPSPLRGVRALHNGGAGLFNVVGNSTTVRDSWWEGNLEAGVRNDDPLSFIDATQNYWGHPSGPRHALNPLGQGDAAVGGVLFTPFLVAPPPASGPAG